AASHDHRDFGMPLAPRRRGILRTTGRSGRSVMVDENNVSAALSSDQRKAAIEQLGTVEEWFRMQLLPGLVVRKHKKLLVTFRIILLLAACLLVAFWSIGGIFGVRWAFWTLTVAFVVLVRSCSFEGWDWLGFALSGIASAILLELPVRSSASVGRLAETFLCLALALVISTLKTSELFKGLWQAFWGRSGELGIAASAGPSIAGIMGISSLVFIVGDAWRFFSSMDTAHIWALHVVAVIIWSLLLIMYLPGKFRIPELKSSWTEASKLKACLGEGVRSGGDSGLNGWAWLNLRAHLWAFRFFRVAVGIVTITIGFTFLGVASVDLNQTRDFIRGEPSSHYFLPVGSAEFVITPELLKVASGLAELGAVFFVLLAVADRARLEKSNPEKHFIDQVVATWAYYMALRKKLNLD
ncbi:hypothetical protein P3T37_007466, partial [Kitasatospora sp. MAA4]|uniref:hypothetical protein n=1 Tax=Kitasatospora sp. MAA4 TaxID=3035093 RepID=UPI00247305C2